MANLTCTHELSGDFVDDANDTDNDRANRFELKDRLLGNVLNDFRQDPDIHINELNLEKIIDIDVYNFLSIFI